MCESEVQDDPNGVGMIVNSSQWESRRPPELRNVSMRLEGADLWQKFHAVTTEMIITKTGRNMFPVPTVNVSGLDPEARYYIMMEVFLASDRRFKFVGSGWQAAGKAEHQIEASSRLYIHPDSPALGAHWMREPIRMKTAKLSNNTMSRSGHIILTSMHKYIPRLHVVQTSDILQLHWSPTATFSYPETEFIAVTAYQNEQVTKLKINNNPFAKGFRKDGLSYMKRKKSESGAKQKRFCSERSSESPVEAAPATTTSTASICSSGSVEQKEEDLSTAVTNININTNTIQYPYSTGIYSSDALVRSSESLWPLWRSPESMWRSPESMWRYPYLLPTPPPLLHPCFLSLPYPPYFLHNPYPQPYYPLPELSPEPCDYSLRDKSDM